jgi:hypothetical protein
MEEIDPLKISVPEIFARELVCSICSCRSSRSSSCSSIRSSSCSNSSSCSSSSSPISKISENENTNNIFEFIINNVSNSTSPLTNEQLLSVDGSIEETIEEPTYRLRTSSITIDNPGCIEESISRSPITRVYSESTVYKYISSERLKKLEFIENNYDVFIKSLKKKKY